jgi:hypothetical protein
LLPFGFGLGDFISAAKSAFVEAACEQIAARGERPSDARIAVVTGLSRAEVAKTRQQREVAVAPFAEQRTERVMHGWFSDMQYVDAAGNPRVLPMTGPASFEELVKKYSGDIPRRAVLRELLAGGMAEVNEVGAVRPLRRHYLLSSGRPEVDLDGLVADADVFFRSAINSRDSAGSAVRRVSVRFPDAVPLSVRRTVAIRTERFLEALADYLHAESASEPDRKSATDRNSLVFHVMVNQCEADDSE